MHRDRRVMAWINVIGGVAVLGSYAHGIWTHPEITGEVWGGVPEWLKPFYTVSMLTAAAGYLAFTYFLFFRVEPDEARVADRFSLHERAKAIGLWAGMSGLALALGPTVGGLMVEHLGWQSIFFLNVPIGIVAFFVATRTVKESVSAEERQLDLPGLALGTAGLFSLTYALIEANQKGWGDPLIVSTLVGGFILIGAFLYWELHAPHPMMPLRFFRIPAFSAGNTVAFSVSLGMFATFFFLSLYMQLIRGYTPFEAGVRFLPMTLAIVFTAPLAGKYASTHGSRAPMTYGLLLAGGGLLFFGTQLEIDTSYWLMLPVFIIMGHGMASVMAPMTAAVMNAVGPQRAGLGSAMTNTSREVGGVFGIALLGTILTTRLQSSLTPALSGLGLTSAQQQAIATAGGHGTLDAAVLKGLTPAQAAGVYHAYSEAFMAGFHVALFVGGLVLVVAAIVANRFIPGRDAVRVMAPGDEHHAVAAAEA